jgi:hypothetical protein
LIKELRIKIKNKTLRDKPKISSSFELNGKIKKKNQIHKRTKKKKIKRMRTRFKNENKNKIMDIRMKLKTN